MPFAPRGGLEDVPYRRHGQGTNGVLVWAAILITSASHLLAFFAGAALLGGV